MKSIYVIVSLVLGLSQMAQAQSEIRSKELRKTVCEAVAKHSSSDGVSRVNCLDGSLKIVNSAKQKIEEKGLTTLLIVQVNAAGVSFSTSLTATLDVDLQGKIHRTGWVVKSVETTGLNDAAVLRNSWTHFENVKRMEAAEVSPALEQHQVDLFEITGEEDIEYSPKKFYKILHPETNKVVGYIVQQFAASESIDMKGEFTEKLNLDLEVVDTSAETFNYHE